MIDLATKFGRHVKRRLAKDQTLWLTTVGQDLTPQPRLVWFYWDGESFLIFSQATAHKVRHLKSHPRVSLNLNKEESGHEVPVITGTAVIDSSVPPPHKVPAYFSKYRKGIANLGMSPEEFGREYPVAIRVIPSRLRGT